MFRRVSSEPLVHFLVLGVALFALFHVVSPDAGSDRRIVVNDATVAMIAERHASVWLRPPTAAELQALVDTHIREEILYREGVARGFDRDDTVIRRRVLQKLEVLGEETGAMSAPTDAELTDYLQKNAARYAEPPIVTFQQVMFDPRRRGAALEADFNAALVKLNAGADPARFGDSSLLPAKAVAMPADRLAREYGDEFATAVTALPIGSWQGPIRSGFGVHIVRVDDKLEQQAVGLADVRAAVERDWENERRKTASEAFYQSVRRHYDIRIEAELPALTSNETER